jgi:WS/DGAT/MGAT family acyltransferase
MYRLRGSDAQTIYTETAVSPFVTLKVMIYEPVSEDDVPTYTELKQFIKNGLKSWCDQGLSMRVVRVPFDLHHPVWFLDPDFNIDEHIHNVALPKPGNSEKLCEFVSYILSMPMDQGRPLWDSWIVEGLEGGRIAWFCKVHHVHADGMMSADQIVRIHQQDSGSLKEKLSAKVLVSSPGRVALVTHAILDLIKSYTIELPRNIRVVKKARKSSIEKIEIDDNSTELPKAFGAPYTCLNSPGGHYRRFDYHSVSLSKFKLISKKYNCTINTLVLSVVSEVIRRYFIEIEEPVPTDPWVVVVPVAKQKVDNAKIFLNTEIHNNNLALAFVSLDLKIVSFCERLDSIRRSSEMAMAQVRHSDGRRIDSFSDYLPGILFTLLNKYISYRQRKKRSLLANISISNVPGPKEQLLACDGRLKMVDLLSCGNLMDINAMGVTVWSYVDNLCFNLLFRKGVLKKQYRIKEILSEVILELEEGG